MNWSKKLPNREGWWWVKWEYSGGRFSTITVSEFAMTAEGELITIIDCDGEEIEMTPEEIAATSRASVSFSSEPIEEPATTNESINHA